MANVTLGKVAPTPKGEWNGALEYEKLDIVTNTTTHKVYMAIQNVPANTAITNNEYWEILGIQSSDAEIDDTAGDGDINKVWSADKSYDEITNLKNSLADEYENNNPFTELDYVWKDDIFYKAKINQASGEVWTSGHWNKTKVSDSLKNLFTENCKLYDSTKSYSIGDYCRHLSNIYRCKNTIPEGGESWASGHWTLVTNDIFNECWNNSKELPIIVPYISLLDDNKINSLSFDIVYERYKNINYIDILKMYTAISAYDAASIEIDNRIKFRYQPYSIKCTTDSSKTSSRFRIRYNNGVSLLGTQEIELYFYLEDQSLITGSHKMRLQGITTGYEKYYDGILYNGWNKIRFTTEGTGTDFTKSETDFRVTVYTTSVINIWIGGLFVVQPDKSNLIIIDDGPYKTFYDIAYPLLKAINVPVTWAIDPLGLGNNSDPNRRLISQEEVDILAYDGLSEFSFHSYDGTTMTGASPEVALRDTINSIRYLQQHGLQSQKIFRAAWFHNDCTNPEMANEVLDASASYNGNSGFSLFPFEDKYNIARYPMQSRTTETVDSIFNSLYNRHCTMLMYTHGISNTNTDVSETLLNYYINKISEGISGGWLNPTTYNRLIKHYEKIN